MATPNNYTPVLQRKTTAIIFVIIVLIGLAYVHLAFWPKLILRMDSSMREGSTWSNIRLCTAMVDEIEAIWYPHAKALMKADSLVQSKVEVMDILTGLRKLPGVKDAFYMDLTEQSGRNLEMAIPYAELATKLDKRKNKRAGGGSKMMRRLIGGMTRFNRFTFEGNEYPLMLRYVGFYYPGSADKIVGLVLDEQWFIEQIPTRLDSLSQESMGMLFMASALPDTNFNPLKPEDPYASPGGHWKQTLGATYKGDTLWWYGDPKVDAMSKKVMDNYYIGLDEFNLTIGAKAEFPSWRTEVLSEFRKSALLLAGMELGSLLIIIFVYLSARLTRKQFHRNQIALAHLAHAIKTPVARLRLNTDSLLKDMVTSPEEEKDIIHSISNECERLEGAVHGASLSLEGIKHRLKLENSDLKDIIADAGERWKTSFDHSGVKLNVEGDSAKGMYDRELLSVMLDNLLDNALRHTVLNKDKFVGKTPEVTLGLRRADRNVRVTVDDMGGGIPAKDRKQIFKRFQRVTGSAGTGVTGLGLGLALVREIAEAHGGKVKVEDNDRGGARFVVELDLSGRKEK